MPVTPEELPLAALAKPSMATAPSVESFSSPIIKIGPVLGDGPPTPPCISNGNRAVVVPIPIFPLKSTMGEFPILIVPVNSGIVPAVPLPVTCAGKSDAKHEQSSSVQSILHFIVFLPCFELHDAYNLLRDVKPRPRERMSSLQLTEI
jgi:hypothetical protein